MKKYSELLMSWGSLKESIELSKICASVSNILQASSESEVSVN